MSKPQIFGQRHDAGYFALFGRFEGVLIYVAMAVAMVLCFLLTGEYVEGAALLAPLALGLAVLAALRFRLAGALASGLIAASIFWIAYAFGWGALPERGVFFGPGLVLLVYIFSFCASMVVSYHMRSAEISGLRETMLRHVLDSLPIGVWVRSRKGYTIFVNERWADFGQKGAQQILESSTTAPPVDLGEGWKHELEEVLRSDGDLVRYRSIELKDPEGRLCTLNLLSMKFYIDHLDDYGTLSLLVDETIDGPESAARAAAALRERGGSPYMAITLGAQGAVLCCAGGCWHATPADLPIRSAVGSGDAFSAGLIAGIAAGLAPDLALRQATAAGTANALHLGAGLFGKADVRKCRDGTRLAPIG